MTFFENFNNFKKNKLIYLKAPVLTQSGYGVHSRQIFNWLVNRSFTDTTRVIALNWGMTPWMLDEKLLNGTIGSIMQRTCPPPGVGGSPRGDIGLHVQLPHEWSTKDCDVNVGVTAGVETDRCNPAWVNACNTMQHVIVPSEHAKRTFLETADGRLTTKITVIPESYPKCFDSLTRNSSSPMTSTIDTNFNFLLVGQLTGNGSSNDRKNTFNTLKWLIEKFDGNEDVGLIIKTNMGRNNTTDRHEVAKILHKIVSSTRKGRGPKIHLLHGNLTDEEMGSLYVDPRTKALVNLTRGEGFGLPLLEAAVCGLPIIATGWSGHLDFLGDNFVKIDYSLKEIDKSRIDNVIFVKGSRWAEPYEEDFKSKLDEFIQNYEKHEAIASKHAETLKKSHSFRAIDKLYEAALGEYFK